LHFLVIVSTNKSEFVGVQFACWRAAEEKTRNWGTTLQLLPSMEEDMPQHVL
jgi:hypothetical protein